MYTRGQDLHTGLATVFNKYQIVPVKVKSRAIPVTGREGL
jgi:hypothetical protein